MQILENEPMASKILPWSFGVAIFSQVCTFFSISFFDQSVILVYFVFAVITFLTTQIHQAVPEKAALELSDFAPENTNSSVDG